MRTRPAMGVRSLAGALTKPVPGRNSDRDVSANSRRRPTCLCFRRSAGVSLKTSGRSKSLVTGLGRHFCDHRVTSPVQASLINTDEGAYGYDISDAPYAWWPTGRGGLSLREHDASR